MKTTTTETKLTAAAKVPLNTAIGGRDLCAWQPVRGIWWIQTRNPNHADRLARIKGGRLVARGVAGGYLRTFEFAKSQHWVTELLARYTQNETRTNGGVSPAI